MPRICLNCGAQITCGCQDRVAADGKTVCVVCVEKYNRDLNSPQPLQNLDFNNVVENNKPVIQNISHNFNNFQT